VFLVRQNYRLPALQSDILHVSPLDGSLRRAT
jgi:hypothetical protein